MSLAEFPGSSVARLQRHWDRQIHVAYVQALLAATIWTVCEALVRSLVWSRRNRLRCASISLVGRFFKPVFGLRRGRCDQGLLGCFPEELLPRGLLNRLQSET